MSTKGYVEQREPFIPEGLPKRQPTSGMNLGDAMELARDLGCVIFRMGTQDYRIAHPLLVKSGSSKKAICTSHGRKDAPRILTQHLMAVYKALESELWKRIKNAGIQDSMSVVSVGTTMSGGLDMKQRKEPMDRQYKGIKPTHPFYTTTNDPKVNAIIDEAKKLIGTLSAERWYRINADNPFVPFGETEEKWVRRSIECIKALEDIPKAIDRTLALLDEATKPKPEEPKKKATPLENVPQYLRITRRNVDNFSAYLGVSDMKILEPRARLGRLLSWVSPLMIELRDADNDLGTRLSGSFEFALKACIEKFHTSHWEMLIKVFTNPFEGIEYFENDLLAVRKPDGARNVLGPGGVAEVINSAAKAEIRRNQLAAFRAGQESQG